MSLLLRGSVFAVIVSVVFGAAVLHSISSARAQEFWQRLPGSANDVGDGWIIGTNTAPNGFGIYRWDGRNWMQMPGSAVRIGGSFQTPWVVNDDRRIYRWNGNDWDPMPGSARDVGNGWVIGTISTFGGYRIYRWNEDRANWDQMPGGAVRIGGNFQAPWVVNDQDEIYRWNEDRANWDLMPGSGKDVGSGWIIGTNPVFGGFGIYEWNGDEDFWEEVDGGAVGISKTFGESRVYIVNEFGAIYVRALLF